MDPMTDSRFTTTNMSKRARGIALIAGALLAVSATVTAATPASAAAGDIKCPSTACVRIVAGLSSTPGVTSDGAGSVYLTYGNGDLRKVSLATGAASTVATGLGNLRGVAVADGNAYLATFGGTLEQVTLATGSRRTLAAGLPSLFGVARGGTTTYLSDANGEIVAVPDGGSPRVVATGLGFSYGIALDNAGFAYTADMGTGDIRQTSLTTGTTRTLFVANYEPTSIAVGNDGLIYFLDGDGVGRVNPTTKAESHVANVALNLFDFALEPSGAAYTVDGGGTLWQINGLTAH